MKPTVLRLTLISAILAVQVAPMGAQQTRQVLTGHLRPAVAEGLAKPVGQMPATQSMNLSIVLPLRNQEGLRSLLARLYDPSSPDYHKYLSVAEFTNQFGPTEHDYEAVANYVRANGMTVTGRPANRLVVPVSGTVDQIQKAFNVSMKIYPHPTEKRTFYSPDREPSLTTGISIAHIAGLNNFSIPRPMLAKGSAAAAGALAVQGSGPGGSYLGVDMRAAYYGGTSLTGNGQAVGLLQFDGYDSSDVALTFANTGQTNSVPINNVLLDGATGGKCQFNPFPCEDAEQVLDIVQAAEMAPGLDQVRVYIGNLDTDILNEMASENLAKQLSVSWTWTPDDPATDDVFFQEFAAQGQSVFVASGDDGAFSPDISDYFYPAEDGYVTAVGGTSLVTTGAAGQWVSETAWNHSGGGISPDGVPIPDWQAGVANSSNQASTTLRNIPDVAMEADFDNYDCNIGTCQSVWGGTSFAAPRWAGFAALINQQAVQSGDAPIGFLNPALYAIGASSAYASTFHDITAGQNDDGGADPPPQQIFQAAPGYDLVTGWGSPDGQSLIDALAPKTPTGFQLSSSIAQLIITPGNSGSATITIEPNAGSSGPVNLGIKGLPDGVTATWSENPVMTGSQLTFQVASSALHGSYLLTITGTSATASAGTTIALVVNAPGFVILPSSGAVSIRSGLSGGTQVAVTRFAGFTGPVSLAITSPLPAGVSAVWSGNPAQDQASLTFSATDSAPLATTVLTITGTSGNLTATATVSVNVGQPGFWLYLAPPPSVIQPGGQVTSTVTLLPIGNFNEPATLTATDLPAGVTASFSPATISPGQSSVMTLIASSAAVAGSYSSNAVGAAANSSGACGFQFVIATNPSPSIAFVFSPALVTIAQGQSAIVTGTMSSLNGYTGEVSMFGIPQLPNGMSFSFNPTTLRAGGSTQLTLTAGTGVNPGNYAVGVGGEDTGGGPSAGVPLFITITPATSLSVGLSPSSLTLIQGQSATATATVTSSNGALGNVNFAVVSSLPEGLSAVFSAGQSAATGVLTLSSSSSLAAGTYTLNIAATSGTETVDAPVTITVTKAPATYTMSATPSSVSPGGSASSTITVSSSNGYTGSIALSCAVTSSPAGAIDLPTCVAGSAISLSSSASRATSTVTVSTTAATTSASVSPPQRPGKNRWTGAEGAVIIAGLIFVFLPRARKNWSSMVGTLLLASILGGSLIVGCGGGAAPSTSSPTSPSSPSSPGTSPGTTAGIYTITVSAKGNDAQSTAASATFSLTVQ